MPGTGRRATELTAEDLQSACELKRGFDDTQHPDRPAFRTSAGGLAIIGVYGVLSHAVSRRFGEYGLRSALGATAHRIARPILRRAVVLVGLGVAAGVILLGRLLASLLYGVRPTDLPTLVGAATLVLVAGNAASLVPALRAARSDPVRPLRPE